MARIGRPQGQLLVLSDIERDELDRLGRSQSASHSLVRRAQIILASAAGEANTSIASRLGVSNPTICHWRKVWFEKGLTGLYGEARSGRPRTHDEERIASLLRTVLESKPVGATHWTVRSAAAASGLPRARSRACLRCSTSGRTAPRPSGSRAIRCSSTRCAISLGSNVKVRPFQWTASSDAILAKLERLCKAINGTAH